MTQRLTDEELAELAQQKEAATPGVWAVQKHGAVFAIVGGRERQVAAFMGDAAMHDERKGAAYEVRNANAELCISAVNALPSLLAEVRELRKQAATEEGDAEHLGEFCIAAADGVLMLLAAAENSRKALAEAQAEAEVYKCELSLWSNTAGWALQKYATQTGCARPGEHLGKAALAAVQEANELRAFKARVDAVINCDRCRFGIEYGELGDADACSKCGGLERAVKP